MGAMGAAAAEARMAKTALNAARQAAAIKEGRLDDMIWLRAPFERHYVAKLSF
jgi:hypothetical protein